MMEPKSMKIIAPGLCPHCGQEIIISQNMVTPVIGWVLKKEDVEAAKQKVIKEVVGSPLPDAEKAEILKWLESPETMFGPEEVQPLIKQMLNKQEDETN